MSICFEELDEQELNIILRDLAVHENLDVKELFGLHKLDEKNKKNKNNSKKHAIISTNNKRIESVQVGRDSERLQYFDELSSIDTSTLDEIKHFKTKHKRIPKGIISLRQTVTVRRRSKAFSRRS